MAHREGRSRRTGRANSPGSRPAITFPAAIPRAAEPTKYAHINRSSSMRHFPSVHQSGVGPASYGRCQPLAGGVLRSPRTSLGPCAPPALQPPSTGCVPAVEVFSASGTGPRRQYAPNCADKQSALLLHKAGGRRRLSSAAHSGAATTRAVTQGARPAVRGSRQENAWRG
jgi:hypothetical protein